MKGKDLINIGIFSAIYFVIVFTIAILGMIPIFLPLSHYHGITIGFLQEAAQEPLSKEMPFLSADLELLSERFCPKNKEFLLRTNEQINAVLGQLYHPPKNILLGFFRVKIGELLLRLSDIDTAAYSEQRQYFPASQTDKVKKIHSLIAGRLDKTSTVEEISEISGMPSASLRKVFKAVYGAPVYQYMKAYKMKAAAEMLISEQRLNIADIAQMDTIVTEVRNTIDAPEMVRSEKLTKTFSGGDIVLDNVRFGYEGKEILHGISMTIHKGEFAALVGLSGGQKQRAAIASALIEAIGIFKAVTSNTYSIILRSARCQHF